MGKSTKYRGYRARVVRNNFFWGSEKPDKIPMEKLIIYEMHVRSSRRWTKVSVILEPLPESKKNSLSENTGD